MVLRILASYEAKIAKICNLGTFWPVIQLITMFSKSDIALYTSTSALIVLRTMIVGIHSLIVECESCGKLTVP